jgi:tRNA(Ile)-lysidine synthase
LAGGSIPPVGTLPLIATGNAMKRGASSGVVQRFLAFLDQHDLVGNAVGIGFSGGADSTALAICASEAHRAGRLRPVLIHVDHGVRPDSRRDRLVVEQTAVALELELMTAEIQGLGPESTEANMRESRYLAIADRLARIEATMVMTGHHARDQAETVLLHLVRGQGAEGASGMAPIETMTFGDAELTVARPLLEEMPADLAGLVTDFKLDFVEDPTNAQLDRARNLIRHKVIPILEEINPGATLHLARSTQIARSEHTVLETITGERLVALASGPNLSGSGLCQEPVAIQRRVIRAWVASATGLTLSFDRTEAVRRLAAGGAGGLEIELGEGWLARQRNRTITLVRND